MTALIETSEWAERAAVLARELVTAGKLSSPEWYRAVREVPRHVFVPSYYVHRDGAMVAADATGEQGHAQWLDTVYSNTALVTKLAQDPDSTPPVFLSGTVKLTLIMIYFANTNTRCSSHARRMVPHFVVALAK